MSPSQPPARSGRPPRLLPPTLTPPTLPSAAPGVPVAIPVVPVAPSVPGAPTAPVLDNTAPLPVPIPPAARPPAEPIVLRPAAAVPVVDRPDPRPHDRVMAVMAVVRGETTVEHVARVFGVHVARVQVWVDRVRDINQR